MAKILKILTISMVLAGILIVVLAGAVFAAGPQNEKSGNNSGQTGSSTVDAVSKLLGLTPEQIQEQRQSGLSLVQIAATKNVSETALFDAIMLEKQTALKNMVTSGTITQAQADQRLTLMRERVQLAVNRTTTGPPEWSGTNGNGQNRICGETCTMKQDGFRGNQVNGSGSMGTCSGTGKMMRAGKTAR
jgi:hypothetical protein